MTDQEQKIRRVNFKLPNESVHRLDVLSEALGLNMTSTTDYAINFVYSLYYDYVKYWMVVSKPGSHGPAPEPSDSIDPSQELDKIMIISSEMEEKASAIKQGTMQPSVDLVPKDLVQACKCEGKDEDMILDEAAFFEMLKAGEIVIRADGSLAFLSKSSTESISSALAKIRSKARWGS